MWPRSLRLLRPKPVSCGAITAECPLAELVPPPSKLADLLRPASVVFQDGRLTDSTAAGCHSSLNGGCRGRGLGCYARVRNGRNAVSSTLDKILARGADSVSEPAGQPWKGSAWQRSLMPALVVCAASLTAFTSKPSLTGRTFRPDCPGTSGTQTPSHPQLQSFCPLLDIWVSECCRECVAPPLSTLLPYLEYTTAHMSGRTLKDD
ncbi:hypothetical protein AOLI_G00315030 [Acnodon oligacanthus]